MSSIIQFCEKHKACEEGRAWAIAECVTMMDVWDKAKPEWLLWVATRPDVLTDRELRLFAVFCARQVEHLLVDQRSKDAIVVAEKFANGEATREELVSARAAALYAANDAARATARAAAMAAADAAWATARAAARAAAWAAAMAAADAAWDAACHAACYAAWDAARAADWAMACDQADAAKAAAWATQCDWLRKNTTPDFGG